MSLCVCGYVHMGGQVPRGSEDESDAVELSDRYLPQGLELQLQPSERAVCALNFWALSPAITVFNS